jgi:uncharacterized protein (TIRG00374 family)
MSTDADRTTGPMGPWWGFGLRGLTLVAALVFLVRGVRWHDMADTIARAGLLLPSVVVVLNACMMGLRALRLRTLLERKLSFASSFETLLTSSALNNITPLRGGNVARLWMLERASGVSKSAAMAMTVVENLIEVSVLAAMGFAASLLVAGQRWATAATPTVFALAIALLVLLRFTAGRAVGTTRQAADATARAGWRAWAGWRQRVHQFLLQTAPGFHALAKPGVPARALLLSLLAWGCETAMIVLAARAMDLRISLPLAIVVLLGINLAMALPSTPASAGPFEGATVAVLMSAGVGKAPALAFAIFYHAVQVIPITLAGAAVLLLAKRRHATHASRPRDNEGVTCRRSRPAREGC